MPSGGLLPLPLRGTSRDVRRGLAAAHPGHGVYRGARSPGNLADLMILGLDIRPREQIPVDIVEFRAWYLTVGGPRPILIEDIEERELLGAARRPASSHLLIP